MLKAVNLIGQIINVYGVTGSRLGDFGPVIGVHAHQLLNHPLRDGIHFADPRFSSVTDGAILNGHSKFLLNLRY